MLFHMAHCLLHTHHVACLGVCGTVARAGVLRDWVKRERMEWCVGAEWEGGGRLKVCQAALKCRTTQPCSARLPMFSSHSPSSRLWEWCMYVLLVRRGGGARRAGFAWWLTVHVHGSVLACNDAWGLLCTLLSVGARQADHHTELRAHHLHPRNSCRTRGSCVLGLVRGPLMLTANRG
jgi:hypothetical protein